MPIPDREILKHDLKQMIIIESDQEDELMVSDIADDEILIGSEAKLGLDSLDSLQLSLAIKKTYAVRIDGTKDGRLAFSSINALADYIIAAQA